MLKSLKCTFNLSLMAVLKLINEVFKGIE